MADPLIVTLRPDPASRARFQAARDRWFPPERNVVPAHVTLFHHLPGDRAAEVAARLAEVAAATPALALRAVAPMSLGRGVAYRLEIEGARAMRARIAAGFALTAQDSGGWRPHATVQNKVAKRVAAATLAEIRAGFAPWEGRVVALDLWAYRGGPWGAVDAFPLDG